MIDIDRVKRILLSPRTEWPAIDAEPGDVQRLYRDWVVWLVAIPAIATFVGLSIIGIGGFGVSFRVPILTGLVNAVVSFALGLAMVWVIAKVVDALAPRFGGRSDFGSAFKLVAYGTTAAMVSGIAYLLPVLSPLALLGALYSLYLIYTGLPVLMKCPPGRALPYTLVVMACGFVIGLVVAFVSAAILPSHSPMAGNDFRIQTPRGEVAVDTRKLDDFAKKMEEAARKVEQASRSGDPAAVGQSAGAAAGAALGAIVGAAGGDAKRKPIGAQVLKNALPESIDGFARGAWEVDASDVVGIAGSRARAEYGTSDRRIRIEIADVGGLASLMTVAAWMKSTGERETQDEVERTYRDGKRLVHERRRKDGRRAEFTLVLENGVMVEAEGDGVGLDALKEVVKGLDLRRLETSAG